MKRIPRASRRVVVLVAVAPANALVAARAERPAAVPGARTVAREQNHSDPGILPRIVEGTVQFVDRLRPERVSHLGAVERDARHPAGDVVVVGDVGEAGEAGDGLPGARIEKF
jgi:hypothetical protein